MIYTLTPNPALDMHMFFEQPELNQLNRAQKVLLEASGKGLNVAKALAQLGHRVKAVLPLGGLFAKGFEDLEEAVELIKVPIEGPTRCNVKVLDRNGNLSEFNAPGPSLSPDEWQQVVEVLNQNLKPQDWLVCSGSLPKAVSVGTYTQMLESFGVKGIKVCLDADGEVLRQGLTARPCLVKPNRLEAEQLLGAPIHTPADALQAARAIQALGAQQVVISMGAQGAVFVGQEGRYAWSKPIRPQSTSGCGDALLAGTVGGLCSGLEWREVALQATALSVARAVSLSRVFPRPSEVAEYVSLVETRPL